MSKPFTMIFYEVEDQLKDFYPIQSSETQSLSDTEQQKLRQQYPNAFILGQSAQGLDLKVLKQRFPWSNVERMHNKNKGKWTMLFKVKDISKKIDGVDIWMNISDDSEKVPLYDGDNMVYVKLRLK